jgi:hypothetical protein
MNEVPLTTLTSWAWIAFTIEVDNALEAASSEELGRHFRVSLPMWANGLRFVDDEGISVDELRAQAGAGVNLGGLERWGYLTVDDRDEGQKGFGTNSGLLGTTILRPTPAGTFARRTWPSVIATVELRQRARFGADVVDDLDAAVRAAASAGTDRLLPWAPPEISPSDGFRTRVLSATGPWHGEDTPLVALLGQLVTLFTLDFERDGDVSLPLAANLLRVLDADIVRVRDLPRRSGLSKEAIAMAVGSLQSTGLATVAPDKSIALTETGRAELDAYRTRVGWLHDPGLRSTIEALLAHRDRLIQGLVPPDGCWRWQKRYRTQTDALLADPTAALPWQPMVLHRGGWPDGS